MKTSERIKKYREKKKLTVDGAAKKLGIEAELWNKWESGEETPDTESIIRIAKMLGTSANMLLYGEDADGARSMFPKEASPSPTPISDWRFLCGVLIMFSGGAGVLLFAVRYMSGAVNTVSALIENGGIPLMLLFGLFALGFLICVAVCISKAVKSRSKKRRKRK